jgi:competence protein ComEA
MHGRPLFLAGVLGLAALAAGIRYARSPVSPSAPGVLHISAQASPWGRRSRGGSSASQAHAEVVVYVAGEVSYPGVYRLAPGDRAEAALRAAGGATGAADLVAVNLAEPLRDGEEIAVPARGAAAERPGRQRRSARKLRVRKSDAVDPVPLNTADEEQLQTLPGIGASLAARISAFRRLNGPFQSLDDLRDVAGMTDGKLDRIAPYLRL